MFENMTFDYIMSSLLSNVPNNVDKREGSIIYDALAPVAIELVEAYINLDAVLNECFADTQTREYLIRRVAERGLTPYKATKAILKAVITPADLNMKLMTRFSLDDINYTVIEKIADGEYEIECDEYGTVGNSQFGKLIPIDYIEGLESIEITEVLIPARDDEETEELRERYFKSFENRAFGGNIADYTEKTNAISGVGATKVTPVWQGGGTVLLTIIDSEYNKASDVLIETVQNTICPSDDAYGVGTAPIGHVVTVKSAEETEINIECNFIFNTDFTFENCKTQIENTIKEYLLELRKTWADYDYTVIRSLQIESRLLSNVNGILDITSTKINGETNNLTLEWNKIPVFGGVTNE